MNLRKVGSRVVTAALVLSLLTTSNPVAAQTLVSVAKESSVSFAFWFRAGGLAKTIQGTGGAKKPQEKQEDRDARVSQIKIHPGDVTIHVDERVSLAAVAYDSQDSPVSGVKIKWSAQDESHNRTARVSGQGDFEATTSGTFKITAEGAGRKAQVKITVLDVTQRRKKNEPPLRSSPISTRDIPSEGASKNGVSPAGRDAAHASTTVGKGSARGARAHAVKKSIPTGAAFVPSMPFLPGDGWDGTNYWSADDPGNGIGNPSGGPADGGAGSGNFQFAAPVVGLPGRGIDISLRLAYNARLWNKAGSQITFDIDRGWPAPGFSLGFGKLFGMGGGSMLIDADGTRHAFTGNLTTYSWGQYFVGHTTDGSLIDYWHWTNSVGWIISGQAKLPNGTIIDYGAHGPGGVFPTRITDPNGNFITITYVNNAGPQIQTVTDTLGRTIDFSYDANNLLTAIRAPGFNNGPARTLVRLHYRQLGLSYSFSGLTPITRESYPWVLDAIYYPATSTGYWFGDSDSYSTYGMLAKVIEQRGMGFYASSLNEQGTVTQGQMTRREVYNYPQYPGDTSGTSSSNLTDAPTYTLMTESWTRDGVNTDQAVTGYEIHQDSSPRTVTITLPLGTKSTQYSFNAPGQFNDGLVYYDETRDSANTLLRSSSSAWAAGSYDSPRPTRVEATNERGQMIATEFSYGTAYNQLTDVRNYDYSGALLRSTRTQYQNSANYTNRHIFNLPLSVEVYASDYTTRVSRADYQYDGQTLSDTPSVVMHDDASNPYAPEYLVSGGCCEYDYYWVNCVYWCPDYWQTAYDPTTDYRGNVTQVTTYADAANLGGLVTENRRYDITGNMVTASTSCCQQTSLSYTSDTQYAYSLSQKRGSASDGYAQVTTSATYDINTGLTLSATDANGRVSETSYDPSTLRTLSFRLPTGAHTDLIYDDGAMTVTESTYLSDHPADTGLADQNIKYLNGRGQLRQEKALGEGGAWDLVNTTYDSMGRIYQQSFPYRSGNPQWSTTTYDALGRVIAVTAPDGSTTQSFYNESSRPNVSSQSAPGETTRVVDAWGRERWGRTDAQGRLVEVVEPNPLGAGAVATGGFLTTYSYNTLGNLIGVSQQNQTRSFKYDSLGRLTAQKLAEANASLNDAGIFGSGTWSDVFTYDDRSNLTSRTDARGVKTVYTYNSDPLNRLQSVSWDTSGFGDQDNPILSAATVSYQYRTKDYPSQQRDVTQVSSVTTSGISSESYGFDSEGRVSSKTLSISNRSSYPMVTDYSYDALDRVTDVRYPAEYGNGSQPRKLLHHAYDVASRLSSLAVDGQTQASNLVYNAASQPTSLTVGAGGANPVTENYSYNTQTGLLDGQTIVRGGNTLLDLSYDYTGANGKRTGQVTKILNNQNNNKDRGYAYDALGRLVQATGGTSGSLWTQNYTYDRYGNRTGVSASGYSARLTNNDSDSQSIAAGQSKNSNPKSANVSPSDPRVVLPTELLARNNDVALPASLRNDDARPVSDSAPPLRPAGRDAHLPSSMPQGPVNLALNKPATQIDDHHPVTTADRAVDGNTNGHQWDSGYTASTNYHLNSWWQVDLQSVQPIGSIEIWGRTDCCPEMTSNFYVLVSDQPFASYDLATARSQTGVSSYYVPGYSGTPGTINVDRSGRYVRVQLAGSQYLVLGEVKVFQATGSMPIPTDGAASLSYNEATNRITTAGFAYDAAGNQVRALASSGGSQRFKYDAANRMRQVLADDNSTVLATYTYGDSNERLIAEEWGLRTYYVSEDGDVIAEYFESNNSTTPQWSKSYIYLGDRLLSTLEPNGSGGVSLQYQHPDRLGTRLVTNPTNGTYFEQVSLPFGTPINGESTGATNRRFTSYDHSPTTGLDYAVNRHYDQLQGRFTQVDPIGMAASDLANPQTLNLYAYCGNDPVNNLDPDGLFWGKLKRFFVKAIGILNAVVLTIMAILPPHLAIGGAINAWIQVFGGWRRILGNKAPRWLTFALSARGVQGSGEGFQIRGTPPWDPDAGTGVPSAFGFQGQEPKCPTCPSLPPEVVNVSTSSSIWTSLRTIARQSQDFAAGHIDEGMLFGYLYRRGIERAVGGRRADTNSMSYKVGWWDSFARDMTIRSVGAGGAIGKAELGPSSSLFRRGGRINGGLLNRNDFLRIGYGWKGTAANGSRVFRIAIGSARTQIHKHITLWRF